MTGSKHLIHLSSGKKILLDCGMFQGMGKETIALNNEWGFDPLEVEHVVISHGHIDHIGLLPKLVKEGYNKKIYCTPATADLIRLLLVDSAHIQEADVKFVNKRRHKEGLQTFEPLYTQEDAYNVFPLLELVPYNEPYKIDDDVELLYTDCGHILGSAAVNLKIKEEGKEVRITFSGDVGRYRDTILRSPDTFPQADYIILESTYGDSLHDLMITAIDELLEHIERTCIQRKGNLIIPAFSLGRTQELLFLLNRLELERRLPKVEYFVDSPLSVKATNIVKLHPECFNKPVQKLLKKDPDVFAFNNLKEIIDVEDSIRLNDSKEPCVIISASGMAEAGRVKHHIAHNIEDARNTILLTGYCEPNSLGGKLKQGQGQVKIFGRLYEVKAEVASIDSLSAHGDDEDLCQWLACQDARQVEKVFLVHGEYDVQNNFRERLIRKGFRDVVIPDLHEEIGLG